MLVEEMKTAITGIEREVLEGGGSEALNEGSEIVGDTKFLEVFLRGRRGGWCSGGGGGGNGGELRGNGDGVGEGLDLVSLAECGGFDLVGFLRCLGGDLLRLLGGFGDEIGDPGGGGGAAQCLRFLRSFFRERLRSLP